MMVTVLQKYNYYMWLCDWHPSGDTEYRKANMIFLFDKLKINIHCNFIDWKLGS